MQIECVFKTITVNAPLTASGDGAQTSRCHCIFLSNLIRVNHLSENSSAANRFFYQGVSAMKNSISTGLPLGMTLGFILSTLIYGLMDSTTGVVQSFIAEQITSIIMLIAASMALYGISAQIQSNISAGEKIRMAKLDAAKSILPIVLSNISQLSKERYFAAAYGRKQKSGKWRWEMTDTELTTLKECIEHSFGVEKEIMLHICRIYQVLIARWENLQLVNLFTMEVSNKDDSNQHDLDWQFIAIQNWAVLEALSYSLFNYARGEASNPTSDEVIKIALRSMGRVHTETLTGRIGKSLVSNPYYAAYLKRKEKNRNLEFINDNWSF